jgi:hypothetical protein
LLAKRKIYLSFATGKRLALFLLYCAQTSKKEHPMPINLYHTQRIRGFQQVKGNLLS